MTDRRLSFVAPRSCIIPPQCIPIGGFSFTRNVGITLHRRVLNVFLIEPIDQDCDAKTGKTS